ncbi:putative disease resistance protein RGA1 [Durio zibethinus]|uniref:Disease resistance protein RGA1 n=1 Tax=Durio zibethinus TaxID=66656 RepID=A0A6P5Z5W8_DURZI|nr:putative disease resistance protein RGA1 [Durio zibethinus]
MLKELVLKFYYGVRLAVWIGDSSFNKLLSICLECCPNCTSLPSIGQLPLLKKLCIKGLDNVTSVGVEFFGKNAPNAFPSLETLEFEKMPKWENWNFCEVNEEAKKFSNLRELRIVKCPELLGSIPENLLSLEKLVICDCKKLVISIQNLPMLSELDIEGCQEVVYKGFVDGSSLKKVCFSRIPKFTCAAEWLTLGSIKVESLKIEDCEELCSLQENSWGLLTQSMSLGELSIGKWSQLVSIGAEEEREELMQLKIPCTIQKLTITDCERLEKLSTTLHYVSSLRFWSCPNLISLSNNNLPSNLKILDWCCENIQCLFEEGENVNIGSVCLLEQLNISYCPSLISLSKTICLRISKA